ncbi:MAG: AI-2E family transporter [bacterium]|nr:AI-2E family transporter [bacterium]
MDDAQREIRIQNACLLILSAIGVAGALYWLRPVMVPFVLAAFLAIGLNPLVDFQVRRLRLPRSIAVILVLLISMLLFGAVASLITASIGQLTANLDAYQAQISQLVQRITSILPMEQLGIDSEALSGPLTQIPVGTIGGMLLGTTNAILDLISNGLLVLIFLIYLISKGPGSGTTGGDGIWEESVRRVERYIVAKASVSAATGVMVGGVLMGLGVDLALVFGLFAFLLNFIPSVGSLIATLLPLPVVLVSPEISPAVAIAAILIPGGIQFAMGNVLEPRIMGNSLDLHPIAILMALIFWGMLWGIVGMLLATPITAVLKILFERMEPTRPLAEVLAGRLGG